MCFDAKNCYILSICSKMTHFYSLSSHILRQVPCNPYLGVTLADDLKFSTRINNIRKASSTIGFLRRNVRFCPIEWRRTAYIVHISS